MLLDGDKRQALFNHMVVVDYVSLASRRVVIARSSERVILDHEPPLTCHDPDQAGIENFISRSCQEKRTLRAERCPAVRLVCIR